MRAASIEKSRGARCRQKEQGRTFAFEFGLKMLPDWIYDVEEDVTLKSDCSALGTTT